MVSVGKPHYVCHLISTCGGPKAPTIPLPPPSPPNQQRSLLPTAPFSPLSAGQQSVVGENWIFTAVEMQIPAARTRLLPQLTRASAIIITNRAKFTASFALTLPVYFVSKWKKFGDHNSLSSDFQDSETLWMLDLTLHSPYACHPYAWPCLQIIDPNLNMLDLTF